MRKNIKLKALLCTLLVGGSMSASAAWNLGSVGDDGNPHTNGNAGAQAQAQEVKLTIFNKNQYEYSFTQICR